MAAGDAAEAETAHPRPDGLRETIESIVIAFVLAFLFKTFIAEAFVIPTGSMATTLLGRHRDVTCPNCGLQYLGSASDEVHRETGARLVQDNGEFVRVKDTVCPNCRFKLDVRDEEAFPSYKGDRILVNKFAYLFSDPERWDVFVFRFPEQAQTNYIKRCVGGNGERIKLIHGDVWTADLYEMTDRFKITKKPPEVATAMLRLVYDNDHVGAFVGVPPEQQWPMRWTPCPEELSDLISAGWSPSTGHIERNGKPIWPVALSQAGGWTTSEDFRSFSVEVGDRAAWLRYRHFLPDDWSVLSTGPAPQRPNLPPPQPRASLIQDDAAYNETVVEGALREHPRRYLAWARDLAVECEIAADARGEIVLELVEGGQYFRCHLDLTSGAAAARFEGQSVEAVASDAFTPGEAFTVRFANIDNRLMLWIDDDAVELSGDVDHDVTVSQQQASDADYSPVGIAAVNASAVVRHLRVLRDVFYRNLDPFDHAAIDVTEAEAETYSLDKGQFFALGDNSAASQDSRAWNTVHFVDRSLLIGKAFFIYWPDSRHDPIPYWPYWRRMGFIR